MEKIAIFNGDGNHNATEGMISVPVSSFRGANPSSDTTLDLYFSSIINDGQESGLDNFLAQLTITANKHKAVLDTILKEFSTGEDYFVIIADEAAGTFINSAITGVSWTFSNSFNWDCGWNGSRTRIKILPRDFIADDGGRPVMIDDTGSDRWVESNSTNPMFASVAIPGGFKATDVIVYGSATSAITVYEADINSKTVTSRGTGNIGTIIDITDVISDNTNYLLIELAQASGEEVYGGYVAITIV